jgi:hypothetical protein
MLGRTARRGRINEVIHLAAASKMKDQRTVPEEKTRIGDNERIKRHVAKYTIDPRTGIDRRSARWNRKVRTSCCASGRRSEGGGEKPP